VVFLLPVVSGGLEPRLRKTEIFPAVSGGSRNTSQLRGNVRKARSMKYVALESDESCLQAVFVRLWGKNL
jgi:hypothetical protein